MRIEKIYSKKINTCCFFNLIIFKYIFFPILIIFFPIVFFVLFFCSVMILLRSYGDIVHPAIKTQSLFLMAQVLTVF